MSRNPGRPWKHTVGRAPCAPPLSTLGFPHPRSSRFPASRLPAYPLATSRQKPHAKGVVQGVAGLANA